MRTVAFVTDLMDRSRLSGGGTIDFARNPAEATGADVIVVDLVRFSDALPAIRAAAPGARLVAYGPHVDAVALAAAAEAGADVVLARSKFFADPASVLADPGGPGPDSPDAIGGHGDGAGR